VILTESASGAGLTLIDAFPMMKSLVCVSLILNVSPVSAAICFSARLWTRECLRGCWKIPWPRLGWGRSWKFRELSAAEFPPLRWTCGSMARRICRARNTGRNRIRRSSAHPRRAALSISSTSIIMIHPGTPTRMSIQITNARGRGRRQHIHISTRIGG